MNWCIHVHIVREVGGSSGGSVHMGPGGPWQNLDFSSK